MFFFLCYTKIDYRIVGWLMKKYVKKIWFLLLVILILPVFVMAENVESEITSIQEMIKEFNIEKIFIKNFGCTRFANYRSSGKEALAFSARIKNDYIKDIDVAFELHLFDANKNTLDVINTVVTVNAKSETDFSKVIYKDLVSYNIDKVAYFSVVAEVDEDLEAYGESEKDSFYYQNYKIKIDVNKNNIYNVQESFDIKFKRHEIPVRLGIPFRVKYTLDDGKKVNKRAVMSNIVVEDDTFSLRTEDGIRNIYMGKDTKMVTEKSYRVTYDYNVGEDTINNRDEFFFYLINNKDNKVDGLEFEIVFPGPIKDYEVSFVDQHGTKLESVTYDVLYDRIVGKFDGMINSEVAYAVKVTLPDGYFKGASKNISSYTILSLALTIVFLLITVLVFFAQKKRDKKVKYNSIYFNDKINSLEMGYLYNGYVRDRDIATLLINLANKGYIKVDKTKKEYKIIKVKDYDSDDRVEKVFMSELFLSGKSVTRKDLVNNVDYMKKNIEFKLQAHKKKNNLFIKPLFNYEAIFWALAIAIFVLNTINIFFEYHPSVILINSILGSIGFILLLYSILYEKVKMEKILFIFVGLMFIIAPIALTKYLAFVQDWLKLITYIFGILAMVVIVCLTNAMSNRSFYGVKMFNKINAYKNYLLAFREADQELKENKNCFYDVLPYTFVLGISDKWFFRFINSEVEKPKWYIVDEFNLEEFYNSIKDIYSDIYISLKNSDK